MNAISVISIYVSCILKDAHALQYYICSVMLFILVISRSVTILS